jgi:tRNA pseudouridine55 synthase
MTPRERRRDQREIDGILLLDKPSGLSSNAALQRAKRAFHARKAGHAGSLDPLATGMLPVCFGQATKACGLLLESGKSYRALLQLGTATSTGDAEGEVTSAAPVPPLTAESVDAMLATFVGERLQLPPMYSALKVAGQRLYELARRGQTVERVPRPIVIHAIRGSLRSAEILDFTVTCSKGTYVRTLGEEIAASFGTVGHLAELRREAVEPFDPGRMVSLEQVERLADGDPDELHSLLLPTDTALAGLPAVRLDATQTERLLHGRETRVGPAMAGSVRAYDSAGRFLGLLDVAADGEARVRRLFVSGAG